MTKPCLCITLDSIIDENTLELLKDKVALIGEFFDIRNVCVLYGDWKLLSKNKIDHNRLLESLAAQLSVLLADEEGNANIVFKNKAEIAPKAITPPLSYKNALLEYSIENSVDLSKSTMIGCDSEKDKLLSDMVGFSEYVNTKEL